jgi:hypothetical protein
LHKQNNYTFAANFNPSNQHKMKKVATIIAFAGALAFVACGPSAADKAKADKMKADSAHMADSVKSAQAAASMKAKADSAAKAAMDKAKMDSAKMADSAKAAPKKK